MHATEDRGRGDGERKRQAQARGEGIRAELLRRLHDEVGQSAKDLLPHVPEGVSLAEVEFQLKRLAEEGETTGEEGGSYWLA